MTPNRLFVLSLSKIQNFVCESEPGAQATIRAQVYRSKAGFPILSDSDLGRVSGVVYTIKNSEIQWSMLDEMMGFNPQNPEQSLYHRKLVQAEIVMGQPEEVWTYFLNPKKITNDLKLIENCDWQKSLQESPPLTAKLSEKQKTYIKRLGACSGRDVIPIDLPLYRELMNLELIVDKGRRLALSKFGQEVFNHIE